MPAVNVDLTVEQGTTYRVTANVTTPNNANPPVQVPYDLTGCTARMQVRQRYTDTTPLFEANTTNGGLTLGGTAGTIAIVLTSANTALLKVALPLGPGAAPPPTQVYYYDLIVILPSGDELRFMQGRIIGVAWVTH